MRTLKPVRWRFSGGPPDLDVIYAAPRARASEQAPRPRHESESLLLFFIIPDEPVIHI